MKDLNHTTVNGDDGRAFTLKRSATAFEGQVKARVVFENHEDEIISCIEKSQIVVGCVAWFTSERILEALRIHGVAAQFIVSDEDWLCGKGAEQHRLAVAFRKLRRYEPMGGLAAALFAFSNTDEEVLAGHAPLRCVKKRRLGSGMMHHKFAVFCNEDAVGDAVPQAVWTGSFNWTASGARSLENGLLVESSEIADSYYREWERVLAVSSPVAWGDTTIVSPFDGAPFRFDGGDYLIDSFVVDEAFADGDDMTPARAKEDR